MFEQQADNSDYQSQVENKRKLWQAIIQEWQLDPINPRIFCDKKNINIDQFGYWRRKYAPNRSSDLESKFVEVTKGNNLHPYNMQNAGSQLNITLPNNIQLSITVPTLDLATLAAQLGGIRC